MELFSFQNIVVYRLPKQKQIKMFCAGEGEERFVFAPFSKDEHGYTLIGQIRSIQIDELEQVFKSINLPQAIEKTSTQEEDYKDLVSSAQDRIKSTNLDKVVLAGKRWIGFQTDVYRSYTSLLENNPNAFVYVSFIEGRVMLGASPELLLERDNKDLHTVALGGTETRGVYTEKEKIEHQQIRDYIESILKERMYNYEALETRSVKASTVSHLKTPYTIEAKSVQDDLNLIKYLHPTSAICGLPYQEALNFIRENEGFDRKFYAGYLGAIDVNNNFNLFVNLRCAELYQDGAVLYAGAGINAMSSPADEWFEINNKMQTIAQCMK
jgi:isochorismate synthase